MGQREIRACSVIFSDLRLWNPKSSWNMALATIFYHLVQHLPQNQTSRQLARWRGGWRREYIRKLWSPRRGPPDYSTLSRLDGIPHKIERKSCQTYFSQTHFKELLGKIRLAVQQISSGNLHFPRHVLTTSRQWRNSNPQSESGQSWNAGGSLRQHRRGKAIQPNRSFSLSRNKKINWKPSCERSQENDML